jgi:2-keto-4-pentenoate hydratase/2-oxohepta-3-ene-1,7-dioic acid hydratase in catechol pathway
MRTPILLQIYPSLGELHRLNPGKIIGVGRNYRAHADEMGQPLAAEPMLFLKPSSALIGSGEAIVRPRDYERVDFEGELAVLMGRRARRVSPEDALNHVLGFTCINDVTVRDLQKKDGQWARAKGFDSFCPIGPRIVCGLDPSNLRLQTRVNGETRQDANTADMVFSVPELIAFISRFMTLEVGDLIATGTPGGVGNLEAGDTVEVDIGGIGMLRNKVVDER